MLTAAWRAVVARWWPAAPGLAAAVLRPRAGLALIAAAPTGRTGAQHRRPGGGALDAFFLLKLLTLGGAVALAAVLLGAIFGPVGLVAAALGGIAAGYYLARKNRAD